MMPFAQWQGIIPIETGFLVTILVYLLYFWRINACKTWILTKSGC
jgi:hypothetical protein